MRHLCVLLLLVFGLSVCSAGYCYTQSSTRSWWVTTYHSVKVCCKGYCGSSCSTCCPGRCGPNCACCRQCYKTESYTDLCCPDCVDDDHCIKKRQLECTPCTKTRRVSYCCC